MAALQGSDAKVREARWTKKCEPYHVSQLCGARRPGFARIDRYADLRIGRSNFRFGFCFYLTSIIFAGQATLPGRGFYCITGQLVMYALRSFSSFFILYYGLEASSSNNGIVRICMCKYKLTLFAQRIKSNDFY
jgi:hypothetical protein